MMLQFTLAMDVNEHNVNIVSRSTITSPGKVDGVEESIRTIEILPRLPGEQTRPSVPEKNVPFHKERKCQYDQAFGREKVFKVVEKNEWQRKTINIVEKFDEKLIGAEIRNLNCVIVSFSVGGLPPVRYNVPHMFFSGNVEKTSKKVFINEVDVKNKLSFTNTHQHQSSSKKSSPIIRAFLNRDSTLTDYAKEHTLQYMVKEYFEEMFYGFDQSNFFEFPIHQPRTTLEHQDHNSRKVLQSRNDDCSELSPQSDILTCQFRELIYSHFVVDSQKTIKEYLEGINFNLTTNILRNIVKHTNNNSESQTIPSVQHEVLRSVFIEKYVREDASAQDILKNVFDLSSFDEVFGETTPQKSKEESESSKEKNNVDIMSKCFLHSEQSFLRKILARQINVKDFIIEYIFLKLPSENTKTACPFEIVQIGQGSPLLHSAGPDGLDSTLIKEPSSNEQQESINNSTKEEDSKEKPTIRFRFEKPIIIDIMSARHICKFCRGSLHLRYNDIRKLFAESLTITRVEEKQLTDPYRSSFGKLMSRKDRSRVMGVDDQGGPNKRPSSETHERMYNYCREQLTKDEVFSKFMKDYQTMKVYNYLLSQYEDYCVNGNFDIELEDVNIRILATSFKEASKDIV